MPETYSLSHQQCLEVMSLGVMRSSNRSRFRSHTPQPIALRLRFLQALLQLRHTFLQRLLRLRRRGGFSFGPALGGPPGSLAGHRLAVRQRASPALLVLRL